MIQCGVKYEHMHTLTGMELQQIEHMHPLDLHTCTRTHQAQTYAPSGTMELQQIERATNKRKSKLNDKLKLPKKLRNGGFDLAMPVLEDGEGNALLLLSSSGLCLHNVQLVLSSSGTDARNSGAHAQMWHSAVAHMCGMTSSHIRTKRST